MLNLNPEMRIYSPPTLIFGGVEIERRPHRISELTSNISIVLSNISDCLKIAYNMKSRIDAEGSSVMYEGSPIINTLDKNCKDYSLNTNKTAQMILKRMLEKNKESAVMLREDLKGVYLLHILKDKFDPETTNTLLRVTEFTIFQLFGYNSEITSSIDDNILKVTATVIPPLKLTYVV